MTTATNPNAVVQPQVANQNGFISSFEHVELADGLVLRPMTDRLLVAQLDRTDLLGQPADQLVLVVAGELPKPHYFAAGDTFGSSGPLIPGQSTRK